MRILIVDDDLELGEMLAEFLAPEGFAATLCGRGDEGLRLALEGSWDAVVLDIMLPALDGLEVLRRLRAVSAVPVVMLTAKGDDLDRILGLEMGADDYLPKPFNPRELAARLRAVLRRHRPPEREAAPAELVCRSLLLRPASRSATVGDQPLDLTSTEYSVLLVLAERAGQVVSKEELYLRALGRPMTPYDRALDVHISHLRRKLAALDPELVIHTIRGTGYQLER
ncbi:MAG: DNA-binding response regulator [Porticoccaceae bacterium]|nr:MAG: DNA-binding response regulator [Porticoccaceae bacterium]